MMKDLTQAQHQTQFVSIRTHFIRIDTVFSWLPFVPFSKRSWNITKKEEWIGFSIFAIYFNLYGIFDIYCASHMPLGDLAALETGCMAFAPIIMMCLYRRCVPVEDALLTLTAFVGLMLIVQPSFKPTDGTTNSYLAYLLACVNGIALLANPFFIGRFPHVHWSSFVVLRTVSAPFIAIAYLTLEHGWQLMTINWTSSWPSIISASLLGLIGHISRISFTTGVQEMEAFDSGSGGLMGNLINACIIPAASLFALAIFGEHLSLMEQSGTFTIFLSIIIATIVKLFKTTVVK